MTSVGIVEDDTAVREALCFSLEREGFTVRTFGSATAFLEDGDALRLDCLVVDQQMPEMTGVELVIALRRRGCLIPAILITTWPDHALRLRAIEAGCRAVLEKPLTGSALADLIHAATDEAWSTSV
ncbi:response regulator transcription factor [Beijerinckia sp. L45]|uniref:response regulator transcription factor n=1 Tax=Beijerinckia sp. L45 TaxID=1641855 RepID=UPI00131EC834|nr:response regulator [Beijerinckia sp. L45]